MKIEITRQNGNLVISVPEDLIVKALEGLHNNPFYSGEPMKVEDKDKFMEELKVHLLTEEDPETGTTKLQDLFDVAGIRIAENGSENITFIEDANGTEEYDGE